MESRPQGLRIVADVPRTKRVRVLLGESHILTTSRDVLRATHIREGADLSAEAVASLVRENESECARQRALRLLAHRERSEHEIRRRLVGDGYPEEIADAIVARLAEVSLIDDQRFSAALVRTKRAAGWGRNRIARALKDSGVDDDAAHAALDAECPEDAERSRAEQVAKGMPRENRKGRERVLRRLLSRGFTWEDALAVTSFRDDEDHSNEPI
ncbi:MAG: recombination regulator RecX [Coriobacteriia bacterium]|nr:recombination regulator RecX [Coriobacteriia bacterium]